MSTETWGQMPKSQTDSQLIEEMVQQAIDDHEADPEAHLGAGESIEVHRTQEALDHPAGSIAVDKISNQRVLMTSFESIDGWVDYISGSGAISVDFGSVTLGTGATSGSYAGLAAVPSGTTNFNSSKDAFWRATLRFAQVTNQLAYFGLGSLVDLADFNGFGFKVSNGLLYAYMGDGSNYTDVEITGYSLTNLHTFEVRYYAATPLVEFYIDGNLEATFDSGDFPASDDPLGSFIIKNTAGEAKYLYIFNFMYQHEL